MTHTTQTADPIDVLIDHLAPTLDEAVDAYAVYEASGGTDDFATWNVTFVNDYFNRKFDAIGSPSSETSTPAKSPSKPTAPSKQPKPDKADKAPKKPTKPTADGKEVLPANTIKPAVIAKSGKVETTLTPAEKTKREAQLKTVTDTVRKETSSIANSYMRIGFQLWTVKERKLYLSADLKNVYEYAEIAFEFKRSSVKNFIAVCEKFSCKDKDGNCTDKIDPLFAVFCYTQLSEMLPLSDEALANVKPEMSSRDIHALKSGQPAGQSDTDTEDGTDTKPTKTVCFDGAVTVQTWDRILGKLEKLLPDGKHIQITIIG